MHILSLAAFAHLRVDAFANRVDQKADIGGETLTFFLQLELQVHPDGQNRSQLSPTNVIRGNGSRLASDVAMSYPLTHPGESVHLHQNRVPDGDEPSTDVQKITAKLHAGYRTNEGMHATKSERLAELMAKCVAYLMVFKLVTDCIDRYLVELPGCSLVVLFVLVLVFFRAVIGILLEMDERLVREMGDWSILACCYACVSFISFPFIMFVPCSQVSKTLSRDYLPFLDKRQETYTFDPESDKLLGIECDADGRVTTILDDSQAEDKHITTGYRILKVETVEYSQEKFARARDGNAKYRLTFEVRRESKPWRRQWTVRCYMMLFIAETLCAVAIFKLFSVESKTLHKSLDGISEREALQGEPEATTGAPDDHLPFLITIIYMVIARCMLSVVYERLIKEDNLLDMPKHLWAYFMELIGSQVEGAVYDRIDDMMSNLEKSCGLTIDKVIEQSKVKLRKRISAIVENITKWALADDDDEPSSPGSPSASASVSSWLPIRSLKVSIKNNGNRFIQILSRAIAGSLYVHARVKGCSELSPAVFKALNKNQTRVEIIAFVRKFAHIIEDSMSEALPTSESHCLSESQAKLQDFVLKRLDEFSDKVLQEIAHKIVDIICAFQPTQDVLGSDLVDKWHMIHQDAVKHHSDKYNRKRDDGIQKRCDNLAKLIITRMMHADIFACLCDEVQHLIDETFGQFRTSVDAEIADMSTKLGRMMARKIGGFHLLPHYWHEIMATTVSTQKAASILGRQSAGLHMLLKTTEDFAAFLPEWLQNAAWWEYVILAPICGASANLFMLRAIYQLGFSYASVAYTLILFMADLVSSGFFVWAVTGRLNALCE